MKMRKPIVAGKFYPQDKEELKKTVEYFLEKSKEAAVTGKLKALIVPHAGYIYSGIVAGAGFKLLKAEQYRKQYKKVILLGPSHSVYFHSASIAAEDFQTPLGIVKVGNTKEWLKERLIVDLPEAHFAEHSLEVEVPFLQEVLGSFELYPFVLGEVDEKALAEAIAPFLDTDTFIVVSSDLSHYLPYEAAVKKDKETIQNILNFKFTELDACGRKPITVLMHLARKLNWKPFLIDYKNSGDTAGDKKRVVGYAAIGYEQG